MNVKLFILIVIGMAIIFGLGITIAHFSHAVVGTVFVICTFSALGTIAGINYDNDPNS